MVTCSAPGKIYVFGEHAVVYGESAICCAIDIRTRVNAEPSESVEIESVLGKTGIDYDIHPYVSNVIERIREIVPIKGVSIKIDSDLPVGSGLGSSAAVTIATIQTLNYLFGCKLSLEDIANLGYEVERKVQGAASPTDTYVSTVGGVVMIPERRKLKLIECGIVIGDTKTFSSTKKLVANVAELRESYPEIIIPLLSTIGEMSHIGEEMVNKRDYTLVGNLMNVNHGLLDAIGVGSPELSLLVYAARKKGALGAKITGAGGGGCMVALIDVDGNRGVADAIIDSGGNAIITKATEHGVILESDI
ncbi:MAG: mevalonate kinase [Methanosarcinaceae archaeon]|nr:mevalonate kinase [Methanosarcinaceae archaeon]